MPLGAVLRMACVGRAERMTAARAFELGLVGGVVRSPSEARERTPGGVVPGASLLAHARQLADRIKQCSPAAVQRTKRAIWESLDLGLADALELGWRAVEGHRGHPDVAEGARAFRERRAPRWHIGRETTS
jgi:enoyl-CoA hydratase/carnithine racemase